MSTEPQVVHGALQNLLRSLDPDQASIFDYTPSISSTNSPQSFISSASHAATPNRISGAKVSKTKPSSHKTKQVRDRRFVTERHRKKKPLNAFIAFRAFYSPQLRTMPQKFKSPLMQKMWAAETRKSLFVLLAKAYTDLRDSHKEELKLDAFLAATAGLLPIIPADRYLEKMGWELGVSEHEEHSIQRSTAFDAEAVDREFPSKTHLSVPQLIDHCYEIGLLKRSARLVRFSQQHPNTVSMPFVIGPDSAPQAQNRDSVLTGPLHFDVDPSFDQYFDPASYEFDFNNLEVNMRPEYRPSIEAVTADQQRVFHHTPFEMHFHPEVSPPILGFDPTVIQDDFDPFSLVNLDDIDFDNLFQHL